MSLTTPPPKLMRSRIGEHERGERDGGNAGDGVLVVAGEEVVWYIRPRRAAPGILKFEKLVSIFWIC